MSDLDKLIEAVEAGTATDFRALLTDSDNPAERAKRCGWAASAFKGSLDAAMRLHEALVPECAWFVNSAYRGDDPEACLEGYCVSVDVSSQIPARAWLLAILCAFRAKGAGK